MRTQEKKLRPIHPGEILREDFLTPLHISANRLALDTHVPVARITDILRGRRAIMADTARRLGRYFGTSVGFWLNLQSDYDLEIAKDSLRENKDRDSSRGSHARE